MKRILKFLAEILVFLLVFELIGKPGNGDSFVPLHGKPVDIYFNDIMITDWGDALPFVDTKSGRTMIPLRFYSEMIGCKVSWFQENKKILISYQEKDYYGSPIYSEPKLITMYVGNRKTTVYDPETNTTKTIWLDQAPWQEPKYPWRVFVPLRFVSECLGDKVKWYPAGKVLDLFPNIITDKDTVMIAHFLPEGPNDYLIVPGERWGKYRLNMPIEQFMKYWGKPKIRWCGNESDPWLKEWRKDKYTYVFWTEFYQAIIYFTKEKGVVIFDTFSPYTNDTKGIELQKYHLLSSSGNTYFYYEWLKTIEDFERDFPWNKISEGTIMRGGENVRYRNYLYNGLYNGLGIYLCEDYQREDQYRGWLIENIYIFLSPYTVYYFFEGEK